MKNIKERNRRKSVMIQNPRSSLQEVAKIELSQSLFLRKPKLGTNFLIIFLQNLTLYLDDNKTKKRQLEYNKFLSDKNPEKLKRT